VAFHHEHINVFGLCGYDLKQRPSVNGPDTYPRFSLIFLSCRGVLSPKANSRF